MFQKIKDFLNDLLRSVKSLRRKTIQGLVSIVLAIAAGALRNRLRGSRGRPSLEPGRASIAKFRRSCELELINCVIRVGRVVGD